MITDQEVIGIIAEQFGLSEDSITPTMNADDIEAWDSLGHIRLCLALEEHFSVELDAETVAELSSIAEITQALNASTQA